MIFRTMAKILSPLLDVHPLYLFIETNIEIHTVVRHTVLLYSCSLLPWVKIRSTGVHQTDEAV